mgnify:CR=1 FL=1
MTYFDYFYSVVVQAIAIVAIYQFGWMYGLIFNAVWGNCYMYVFKNFIVKGPPITSEDENYEFKHGSKSLVYTAKVEKFDEDWVDDNIRRAMRDERLGARVVTFLGRKYWKPIDTLRAEKDKVFVVKSDVHSQTDLNKFCKGIENDKFEGDQFL